MNKFGFLASLSKHLPSPNKTNKRQRGRQCRIEELEGREMLSGTPWALAGTLDYSNHYAETIQTEYTSAVKSSIESSGTAAESRETDAALIAQASAPATVIALKPKVSVVRGAASATVNLTINQNNWTQAHRDATGTLYEVIERANPSNILGTIDASDFRLVGRNYVASVTIAVGAGQKMNAAVKSAEGTTAAPNYSNPVNVSLQTAKYANIKGLGTVKNTKGQHDNITMNSVTLRFNQQSVMPETEMITIAVTTGSGNKLITHGTIELARNADGTFRVADDGGFNFRNYDNVFGEDNSTNTPRSTLVIGGLNASTKYTFTFASSAPGQTPPRDVKTNGATLNFNAPKPKNVRTNTGSTYITANWQAYTATPASAVQIQYYEVACYRGSFKNIAAAQANPSALVSVTYESEAAARSVTLSGLNAGTSYTIFVRAVGIIENAVPNGATVESQWGRAVIKTTTHAKSPNGAPARPAPLNADEEAVTRNSVTVALDPEVANQGAANLVQQIRYREVGTAVWHTANVTIASDQTSATIAELDEGTQYEFQVRTIGAGNSASAWSSATVIQTHEQLLPDGFVYVTDIIPDVILEIRYFSTYNFLGTRVDDYLAPVAILTEQAAEALRQVSDELRAEGYALKVFDAYRPQGAVDHFVRWAQDPDDILTKEFFYPDIDKDRLFPEGYIMERSGHTRGSTVDLTLVDMRTGREVDMGSPFDFFGRESWHETDLITEEQANNRLILRGAMERAGFAIYDEEWWHYTLIDEPFPDTYFTFPVK